MNGATSPESLATAVLPQSSPYTFVCYSRRDLDFVLELASRLQERGVPVWLDLWDIDVGQDWDRTIDDALKGCASCLIVLSPDAVGSNEVRGEWRVALDRRKPVVPVLYRSCEIPRQLRNTQYLDVSDSGELADAQLDALAARLRGESPGRGDLDGRWWKTWSPASWAVARLRAVGAAAAGATVLVAVSGLLAEKSYIRFFGLGLSPSPFTVLLSGLGFFLALFTLALKQILFAGLLLLPGVLLYLAARRVLPRAAIGERVQRVLGRPGLLWTAQFAAYAFLLFFSMYHFPTLLPLSVLAFGGSLAERLEALSKMGYTPVVGYVVWAALVVAALEAWRRRLGRKRQYRGPAEARLSLGLAVPLYVAVTAELLLLAIGHGVLDLPRKRAYTPVEVTFASSFSDAGLRGQTLELVQIRPAPVYTFYCPTGRDGPETWDVDARDVTVASRRPATFARLLKDFETKPDCRIDSRVPEEVTR